MLLDVLVHIIACDGWIPAEVVERVVASLYQLILLPERRIVCHSKSHETITSFHDIKPNMLDTFWDVDDSQ